MDYLEQKKNERYTLFINEARNSGFTDEQVNFLWEWINKLAEQKALSGGFSI